MTNPDNEDFKKYLIVFLSSTSVIWGGILLFCVLIDPYGFIGTSIGSRLSSSKPVLHHQERLTKAYTAYRVKADAIVLGTSRQGHAITVQQLGFMEGSNSAYNFSFDGAHINEIYAYLKHAQAIYPLKKALIGLDFSSFGTFVPQQAFRPNVLKKEPNEFSVAPLLNLIGIYLSFDAFRDSITSLSRRDEAPYWDLSQGIRTDRVFNERLAGCGGTRENFNIRESRDIRQALLATQNINDLNETLKTYQSIINFAHINNIELTLFISPTHARSIVLLELTKKNNLFNIWKRKLVEINEEEAKLFKDASAFRIFDFSGYNSITTEQVPVISDHGSTMQGYWELSHYKRFVGKIIMNRLYPHHLDETIVPKDFGKLITMENIEEHLAEQKILSAEYRKTKADELADLISLVDTHGKFSAKPGCGVL